jgi:hypothetical protein
MSKDDLRLAWSRSCGREQYEDRDRMTLRVAAGFEPVTRGALDLLAHAGAIRGH